MDRLQDDQAVHFGQSESDFYCLRCCRYFLAKNGTRQTIGERDPFPANKNSSTARGAHSQKELVSVG